MSHTYRTINRYYDSFESYKNVISFKSLTFLLFISSSALFFYSTFLYMTTPDWLNSKVPPEYRIFLLMGIEVIPLLLWFRLGIIKERLVIKKMRKTLKVETNKPQELKKYWLEKTLGGQQQ